MLEPMVLQRSPFPTQTERPGGSKEELKLSPSRIILASNMEGVRAASIAVFVISTALFAIGFFPVPSPIQATVDRSAVEDLCADVEKPYEKLVLMVIDAWSWDFLNERRVEMEFIWDSIDRRRAKAFVASVQTPTVTLPRIKAIVSGVVPSFADVVFNFFSSDYSSDNLISILKENQKRVVFYGDDTWLNMFPDAFESRSEGTVSFFVRDYTEVDDNVTRGLDLEIANGLESDALILHYLGLDHIGHSLGGRHPQIRVKLREMDSIVQRICTNLKNLDQSSVLVVLGDHGMTEAGGHGGSSKPEVSVPIVLFPINGRSPLKIDSSGIQDIQQIDLVSSLAALLGVRIPSGNLGVSFAFTVDKSISVLRNLYQLVESFSAHSDSERLQYCKSKTVEVMTEFCSKSEEARSGAQFMPLLKSCTQELKRLQGSLISAQSSFDIRLIAVSLVISALALGTYLNVFLGLKNTLSSSTINLVFVLIVLAEPVIYFASSLTEEEHDVWYFLYSSFLFLSAIASPQTAKHQFALLVLHRFCRGFTEGRRRRWNLDGSSPSVIPDLADVLNTLPTTFITFLRLLTVSALVASSRFPKRRIVMIAWIMFVVRNEFVLLAIAICAASLMQKSAVGLFLAAMSSYYYLGNSNNLSTVDISVGYTGLASYQPAIVGAQISLNVYSGPLLTMLLGRRNDVQRIGDLVILSRIISLSVMMLSLFLQRHHLFVWTVFAPKYLYETAHFIVAIIVVVLFKLRVV